jgi:hypothetical protein
MKKRRPVSTLLQRQVVSKKTELSLAVKQRDALWALLDNIDTLDDSCREHDDEFRKRTRVHLKRRFEIYNPSS